MEVGHSLTCLYGQQARQGWAILPLVSVKKQEKQVRWGILPLAWPMHSRIRAYGFIKSKQKHELACTNFINAHLLFHSGSGDPWYFEFILAIEKHARVEKCNFKHDLSILSKKCPKKAKKRPRKQGNAPVRPRGSHLLPHSTGWGHHSAPTFQGGASIFLRRNEHNWF